MGREGSTNIKRNCLNYLDVQKGRRIILKTIPINTYWDLKCSINKNILLLFESHKPNARPNTIIRGLEL